MYEVSTGCRIGALTVADQVRWVGGTGRNYLGYMCRCDCGVTIRVRKEDLAHGKQLYCNKYCPTRSPWTIDDWLRNTKKSGDCMLWQGSTTNGYGRIHRCGEIVHAHREVHRLTTGDSPEAVMHTCDTPLCINPKHLRSGTNRENTADMVAKGRQSKGVKHYKAKLNESKVRQIRAAYSAGVAIAALARAYQVGRSTIYSIVHNQSWKEVT